MNVKQEIEKLIKNIVKDSESSFLVEIPAEKSHGDYSCNVALVLSKSLGKNPREVAEDIVAKIKNNNFFEKVEIAGPGFINFYLAKNIFLDNLKLVLKQGDKFGRNQNLKNKKILVEHTQPNPFKEFHIGHLMNNTVGESVARILKSSGANVKTASYHGDVGLHVAKAIWGMMSGKNWESAYSFGSKSYEEAEEELGAKKEIDEINQKIYSKSDPKINDIYQEGRKVSIAYFDEIYKKLDTNIDHHFYESEVAEPGKKLVLENVGKVFEKGEGGAVIFKGENFTPKTHTRVFLTSDGLPTYEAKELGLAKVKKDWFKYDSSITITANEQDSFFAVIEVAIGEVFPAIKGKLRHLSHGLLKFSSGKMSSRTGNVITFESLLGETENLVREKMKGRELSEKEKNEIAKKVAIGALKYLILKQSIGRDIIYDANKALSFEGDSGPYLQYSLTRALSVLKKAASEKIKAGFKKTPNELSDLERMIHYFPEIVEKAGNDLEPHHIAIYLTEVAGQFNSYYAKNKIIDLENKDLSSYSVALIEAFLIIMKNGLQLLGISAL